MPRGCSCDCSWIWRWFLHLMVPTVFNVIGRPKLVFSTFGSANNASDYERNRQNQQQRFKKNFGDVVTNFFVAASIVESKIMSSTFENPSLTIASSLFCKFRWFSDIAKLVTCLDVNWTNVSCLKLFATLFCACETQKRMNNLSTFPFSTWM